MQTLFSANIRPYQATARTRCPAPRLSRDDRFFSEEPLFPKNRSRPEDPDPTPGMHHAALPTGVPRLSPSLIGSARG